MNNDWLAVFEALKSVYIDKAYSNIAVNEAVSRHKGVRESFVRTFAKGVLRDSVKLDYIIDRLADKGIKSIKPRPLIILRMGLYAADSLDSVPPYAAVNEAVSLARSVAKGSDRFINGMLRSRLRRSSEFDDEMLPEHIRYAFPKDVFDLLKEQYGDETAKLCRSLDEPPALYLRTNLLRTDRDSLTAMLREQGIEARAAEENSEAIRAAGSGIASSKLFRDGLLSIQSLSSMIAVKAFSPEPGMKVLDMCAAPGGKSCYMAELMGNRGSILACDIYPHRLSLIRSYAERTGASIVETMLQDASEFNKDFAEKFDAVLCDVPCSGLGVIASKPEIKLTTDTSRYGELEELQKKILSNALCYVRPGGRVMYSTCTLNTNENEDVVKHSLSGGSSLAHSIEMRTLMPYNGKVGFFYCIIEKKAVWNI